MVTVSLRRASPMSPSDRSEYHWDLTLLRSTNVISQFDYTYDAAGRRTAIAKSGSAFGDLSGSIDSYTYNTRSELTSARRTKNGQSIPGFSEDFDYDPIGNRRSSSTYNERGEAQTSTYQANNLNQYTSRTTPGFAAVRGEADPNATVTVNENPTFRLGSYYFGSDLFDNTSAGGLANLETYAVLREEKVGGGGDDGDGDDLVSAITNQVHLAQTPETFAYDDDGNQTLITTKTGLWRVTYNGENRPIRWVRDSDDTVITMSYDHMGRRREKKVQRFFYDGYLQVADNAGNAYAWDVTEPIATRPLVWTKNDISSYYDFDSNKNVSEVIAADGSMAAHYEYAPFGAVTTQRGVSAAANPWRFSSEYAEDDLATVYYNYRHYEPVMGRWLQRDPTGEVGELLLYGFLGGVLGTDYCGMRWTWLDDLQIFPLDLYNSILSAKDCLMSMYNWTLNIQAHSKGAYNDKILHCWASCEFAQECGAKVSAFLGVIKEFGDVLGHTMELVHDLLFDDSTAVSDDFGTFWGWIVDSGTDFVADGRGIGCNWSGENCECCCEKKYNRYAD